jgi:hypothetical protein
MSARTGAVHMMAFCICQQRSVSIGNAVFLLLCLNISRGAASGAQTVSDCIREMDNVWSRMPPFQAEFAYFQEVVHDGLATVNWRKMANRDVPQTIPSANRGWIRVYPAWFSYSYIRAKTLFDVSEYPLEIRFDGQHVYKFNNVTNRVIELIPANENTRQQWINHYIFSSWQLDFVSAMRPDENLRRYLLPTALKSEGYSVVGVETQDGVECIHIVCTGKDEIWVAPRYSWNVVRRRFRQIGSRIADELWTETRQWDFVQLGDRYFPRRALIGKSETDDSTVLSSYFGLGYGFIPAEECRPARAPGARWTIIDTATGKSSDEVIPGDGGNQLDALVTRLGARFTHFEARRRLRGECIIVLLAVAVAVCVPISIVLLRRRRQNPL